MYIIVGLGNPESKYMYTRHNAGFLAVDLIAEKHGIQIKKHAHKAVIGEGRIAGQKVVLAKPMTYMNLSGQSVVDLVNWYKIDIASELIVIYDDVDLAPGFIRVRPNGSSGTHNGMRSIIYLTGSDAFARVRIGIGTKKDGWGLADYVLSNFDPEEKDQVLSSLNDACKAVELIVSEGTETAMRAFNKKMKTNKAELEKNETTSNKNAETSPKQEN